MIDVMIYTKCKGCGISDSFASDEILEKGDELMQTCDSTECGSQYHKVTKCIIIHEEKEKDWTKNS